jgi:hypothetical protein
MLLRVTSDKLTDMYMQPPVGDLEALHIYNDHGSVASHERSERVWVQRSGKSRPVTCKV